MRALLSLDACLARALAGTRPVPEEDVDLATACGHVLARDMIVPHALPRSDEALATGFAVAALDVLGADVAAPVALDRPVRVVPGAALPPGTDAVLPEDGTEAVGSMIAAIRPVDPGEGVRRAGHDGCCGDVLLAAGSMVRDQHRLSAALAGITRLAVRRPRVAIDMPDSPLAAHVTGWVAALGGVVVTEAPHLAIAVAPDHRPRLALAPGETAWLDAEASHLVLALPDRFDGLIAGLCALGLPAMAALSAARPAARTRALARKLTSRVGVAEFVLLTPESDEGWMPAAAGLVTLTTLARAEAFAVVPPESEGLPAGSALTATPLDRPFG